MTSQNRIDANRLNAQKSTGPKTIEGKRRSSMNALDHGLCSAQVVLPTEDPAAFDTHINEFIQEWQPVTKTRMNLVKRIAVATWKLDQCVRVGAARLSKRASKALNQWDASRAAMVRRSVALLETEPSRAFKELASSRDGVNKLIAMWDELYVAATLEGGWNDIDAHHRRFFMLQGIDPLEGGKNSLVLYQFLLLVRPDLDPANEIERLEIEQVESVRRQITDQICTRIDQLTDRREALPDLTEARACHAELEAFMPQPEDASLLRYEAHFDREFRASVNQLTRLTKTGDDLVDPSDLLSSEPEIPTITEVESPAPNEPKPEPEAAPAASASRNEPKPVTPFVPIPPLERRRDPRIWGAVIAPEGSDLPQSVGRDR